MPKILNVQAVSSPGSDQEAKAGRPPVVDTPVSKSSTEVRRQLELAREIIAANKEALTALAR